MLVCWPAAATSGLWTQVADLVQDCGIVSPSGDAAAHSARSCLTEGWLTDGYTRHGGGYPGLTVNRALISKGEYRQLVYDWFKQRYRELANEVALIWCLLWETLTWSHTSGDLIWLTTPLQPGEELQAADSRLRTFAAIAEPRLVDYVPE